MTLSETYQQVRKSIVAFTLKYIPGWKGDPTPQFPPIIGTGVIVRSDGLIATNDHVVREFGNILKPPGIPDDDLGINAMLLHMTPQGMAEIPIPVEAIVAIRLGVNGVYYGPKQLDLAFVWVTMKDLPFLSIDTSPIQEGIELATAGFPKGTDMLIGPDQTLHQICPTLQKGIVSAVLPMPCPSPHAFILNVMTQGGASGSPVFFPETGAIAGILYRRLSDLEEDLQAEYYRVPTNFSYVLPSHFIEAAMARIPPHPNIDRIPAFNELFQKAEFVNRLETPYPKKRWPKRSK